MTSRLLTLASLLAAIPTVAHAQHEGHGGHETMDHSQHGATQADHSGHTPAETPSPAPSDHAHHGADADETGNATYLGAMADSSGTSRLPAREGIMTGASVTTGDWMLMAHGFAQLSYTDHKGARGDDLIYSTSMLMLMGHRQFDGATLTLRSMMSLEPTMAARGYPNLFATGETADGEPLVDRQHPHDLFMELAARLDIEVGDGTSVFLYGGPVGEPAIGPSAFMHRGSASYNPEPPITHHWFDSTHITYGVVTAGVATQHWQLEGSAFRGREPDEERWDIETPKLDSWSVRLSWTPTPNWSAQVSHAFLKQPETLHGDQNERRTTASVHYADGKLSASAAFSAKDRVPGDTLTAWLGEINYDLTPRHSLFGRVERVTNDELVPDHHDPLHDVPFTVTKAQAGYAWNTPIGNGPVRLALGGSVSVYAKPAALDASYGSNPWGYTLFARLSLGR